MNKPQNVSQTPILNLPIEARFWPQLGQYVPRKTLGRTRLSFEHRRGQKSELTEQERNPWAVREAFLHVDNFPDFVSRYGKLASLPIGNELRSSPDDEHLAGEADFRNWQGMVTKALTTLRPRTDPQKPFIWVGWLHSRIPIQIEWRDGQPVGVVNLNCVLDAIAFSIHFDRLKGHRFRYCAREDCGEVFLKTRRNKIYHDYDCAHLVAVRKSREREGQPKSQPKRRREPSPSIKRKSKPSAGRRKKQERKKAR